MTKLKTKRGITLIALIVTIIIILLLSGIVISAITNTGIFGKINEAKEKTILAEKNEEVKRALLEVLTDCQRRKITSNS